MRRAPARFTRASEQLRAALDDLSADRAAVAAGGDKVSHGLGIDLVRQQQKFLLSVQPW